MGILALSLTLYVNICIIYATLPVSYFLLSRDAAFSYDAAYGKRILFGAVGGALSFGFQQQNIFWLSGVSSGSFAGLPVLLTLVMGGWVSGLTSLAISIANADGAFYDKIVIVLLCLTLCPVNIWRRSSSKALPFIIIILLVI